MVEGLARASLPPNNGVNHELQHPPDDDYEWQRIKRGSLFILPSERDAIALVLYLNIMSAWFAVPRKNHPFHSNLL